MILTNDSVKALLIERAHNTLLRAADGEWRVTLEDERRALESLRNMQAENAIPASYRAMKTELMSMVFPAGLAA